LEKNMNDSELNRRSFFRMVLAAATIVPFAVKSLRSEAATTSAPAGCPTTPPAGKQVAEVGVGMAKSLEYTTDGKSSTNPKHKPGQNCVNCKYFNEKKIEGGYAPCTMMGMKYVTNCGWCKSYLAK
jgi:hypothetical protein